jgi:trehalose/maltose hydrolase-like predicted phosphorylase
VEDCTSSASLKPTAFCIMLSLLHQIHCTTDVAVAVNQYCHYDQSQLYLKKSVRNASIFGTSTVY